MAIEEQPWCKLVAPIKRQPPDNGQLKLNVDVVVFSELNRIGIGAVVRDEKGTIIWAWSKVMAVEYSPLVTELLALRDALELVNDLGLVIGVVEMDSRIQSRQLTT